MRTLKMSGTDWTPNGNWVAAIGWSKRRWLEAFQSITKLSQHEGLQEEGAGENHGIPRELRLRLEMLVLTLENIESQRQCLESDENKHLSLKEAEKLFSTVNKAYYYLFQVQSYIQLELLKNSPEP